MVIFPGEIWLYMLFYYMRCDLALSTDGGVVLASESPENPWSFMSSAPGSVRTADISAF